MTKALLICLLRLMAFSGFVATAAAIQGERLSQAATVEFQQIRCDAWLAQAKENPQLELKQAKHAASHSVYVQGKMTVPENRSIEGGREIDIHFIVLPARAKQPAPDPIFILHGGPGAPATAYFSSQLSSWLRHKRDVVLIDQRGTGSSNKLQVPMPGSNDDLQDYFSSYFQPELYQNALPSLQKKADLTQYTTNHAVDDFNQIRLALGYQKINLRGGSYGSRAALVYMRRYPKTIRSATLQGIAPIAYLNPLPHARDSQKALDLIFDEIRSTPRYKKAFPDLEAKFKQTLTRLEKEPATVTISHPTTGADQTIILSRDAFAEAVLLQLYSTAGNRRIPLTLKRAHGGDFRELAESSMAFHRSVHGMLAFGMLFCVTASEDIPRIDPDEIEAACANTFLGSIRLRERMAVAAIWPVVAESASFAKHVSVDVPTLLISGSHDPVTSPYWGAEAASHLPNSLHVVVPGGHGVSGPELQKVESIFLEQASVENLDLREIGKLKMPPLQLR